jgi:hypothetical protein
MKNTFVLTHELKKKKTPRGTCRHTGTSWSLIFRAEAILNTLKYDCDEKEKDISSTKF